MPGNPLPSIVQSIRKRFGFDPAGQSADALLLKRFALGSDESAFAALVERHGALVWGTCLRMAGDAHAAEDAFQATWLVLARRAGSVRDGYSLPGWLHRVAFRLALAARARPMAPLEDAPAEAPGPEDEAASREVRRAIDEEINRLPQKYRLPVLLCFYEGRTHAEAAAELGWPVGTVAGRVARARDLLRSRLTRRGLDPTRDVQVSLAVGPVPAELASAAVQAGVALAAGGPAGGAAHALASALLAEGARRRGLAVAAALLLSCLGVIAGVVVGRAWLSHRVPEPPPVTEKKVEPPEPPRPPGPGLLPPPERKEPQPEDVVNAWKEAGTLPGWMGPGRDDWAQSHFLDFKVEREKLDSANAVRAFKLAFTLPARNWTGVVAKLPAPAGRFGLDLTGRELPSHRPGDADLKELAALKMKNLTHLDLSGTNVTDEGLKGLAGIKGLSHLNLNGTEVTGKGLKDLAGLKGLSHLGLGRTMVTDEGLAHLAALENLTSLSLYATRVTDKGLKALAALKHLSRLNLNGTDVTGEGLKDLAGLKGLSHLELTRTKVTDGGLKALKELKSLSRLNLNGTDVTGEGLKDLAGLKGLSHLELVGANVTDRGLKGLKELKGLTHLDLWRTGVTDEGLKDLAALKNLSHLDLGFTKVTDEGLKHLAGLDRLSSLVLERSPYERSKVTDAGMEHLADLKSLSSLDLTHTGVGDAGLKHLAASKSLTSLTLLGCPKVTDEGLKHLAALKSLTSLNLYVTSVTDAGMEHLASLKSLTSLNLYATGVKDDGLKHLAALKNLSRLNLSNTNVTDDGLKHLAALKKLTRLDLSNCHRVTDDGVAVLRKALPGCAFTIPFPPYQ